MEKDSSGSTKEQRYIFVYSVQYTISKRSTYHETGPVHSVVPVSTENDQLQITMGSNWQAEMEEQRRRKDEYFADAQQSPLSPAEQESFEGLEYYPVDPDYRYELALDEFEEKDVVTVATSTDGERQYLAWGEFAFAIDGVAVTLTAYKAAPNDGRLWVPFRDATSGDETYGAGRYLDLEAEEHRTDSGTWVVDFNEAYNPTCAYSDQYDCPLPPTENWLDVPVRAGEKTYKKGHDE